MNYEEVVSRIHLYTKEQEAICRKNSEIPEHLYTEYGVNRGLRDLSGKGVVAGLTNISKITAFKMQDGKKVPDEGHLWYRGYPIEELVEECHKKGFCFERTAYLLLFGEKPSNEDLRRFCAVLSVSRQLPPHFTRDVIMKRPSNDIMNSMTKSILTLSNYDEEALNHSVENSLRQCMELISVFPMFAVYGYIAYDYYVNDKSMFIHDPDPLLSTAENILMMLRPDKKYTKLEAKVLDIALMLHMEHGGGNNSTFTTRVVTSSGADTYAAIAAAMCSLKGPKHGGANLKVMDMMDDISHHVKDLHDKEEISAYLEKILNGEAFDGKGLIYGMGHAVYSLSDPREVIFKGFVERLAHEKGLDDQLALYNAVEEIAPKLIYKKRPIYKGVSPNVDFYSGFVYEMLGIPRELYTPMVAMARVVGWSAHRIEEMIGMSKIIRPAYLSVMEEKSDYYNRKEAEQSVITGKIPLN